MVGRQTLRTLDSAMRRMPWLALLVGTLAIVTISLISRNRAAQAQVPRQSARSPQQPAVAAREGTRLVNAVGSFSQAGGRIIFHVVETGQSFVGLENLSLERVARQTRGDRQVQLWTLSGTVTEYQGTNYVLVSRVVLKDRVKAAPAPGRGSLSGR